MRPQEDRIGGNSQISPSESRLGAAELGTATPISVKNLTPKRRELLKWFQINCASLAEAYEGAIWLLEDQRFPGRVHFIAHAVRDIADRLIFVLDPQTESKRVQYEGEMDKIQKLWPKLDAIEEKSGELLGQDGVNIGRELAVRIDALVRAHCKRRERPSQYELLFRYLVRHEPNQGEVNQRLVFDFKKTRDWFMAFTHLRKDAAPQVNETELQTQFSNFVTCPTDGGRRNRYD